MDFGTGKLIRQSPGWGAPTEALAGAMYARRTPFTDDPSGLGGLHTGVPTASPDPNQQQDWTHLLDPTRANPNRAAGNPNPNYTATTLPAPVPGSTPDIGRGTDYSKQTLGDTGGWLGAPWTGGADPYAGVSAAGMSLDANRFSPAYLDYVRSQGFDPLVMIQGFNANPVGVMGGIGTYGGTILDWMLRQQFNHSLVSQLINKYGLGGSTANFDFAKLGAGGGPGVAPTPTPPPPAPTNWWGY